MKKMISKMTFMLLFLALASQVKAQDFNPQMMAQRQLDRLSTELSLNKDQIKKLEPLLITRVEKMMEFRQAGMEREEMMAEMKKLNDSQLESIKAILTPEQFEKYKTVQSQMRQGGPPRN
ncbi:hypothetical protein V7S76_13130 [Aquirufa sp. ROCK2-A2]